MQRQRPFGWAALWEERIEGPSAAKITEEGRWEIDRTRGSHRQLVHPIKLGTVTVSGHPGDDIHPKTLKSVLRQAGLEEES